ncbi:ribonuclease HI family protein [Chloroflexota bacterium]
MAKEKIYLLKTDGAARPNPGPASVGIEIKSADGNFEKQISRDIGYATNNEAEYRALIIGLEELAEFGAEHVNIQMDSQLVVRQVNGQYRVRKEELKPLYNKVISLLKIFASYTLTHIHREKNKVADGLAGKALIDRES